jgi:hypothetical protein
MIGRFAPRVSRLSSSMQTLRLRVFVSLRYDHMGSAAVHTSGLALWERFCTAISRFVFIRFGMGARRSRHTTRPRTNPVSR